MKLKKYYKKVFLPHLQYTVYFCDLSQLQDQPIKGIGFTAKLDDYSSVVFLQDIEKAVENMESIPVIAHELMHVLQHICEKYNMQIENEMEHTAYIMYYLMSQLLDLEIVTI